MIHQRTVTQMTTGNIQDNVSENSSGSDNENTETTNVESVVSDEIGETKDVSASAVNLQL